MMRNSHKKEIEAVLNTGRILFRHYGFRRTTYNLIADEANVSRYVLRKYFTSKKAIFRSLFEDEKDKVRKKLVIPCGNSFPARGARRRKMGREST